jgi:hypothetical protein
MREYKSCFLFLLSLLFIISACSNNSKDPVSSDDSTNRGEGKLLISITDAPFPIDMVDSTNVVITRIEVRSASSDSGNPFLTVSEDTINVNLLDLQNGVTAILVESDVPTGTYDLVRLYVEHAVILVKDNPTPYLMKVPSGSQTGIKMFVKPSIEVVSGLTSELLLDFDLGKSFVVKGNPKTPAGIKGFNFKPVIRAVNRTSTGRITGVVSDTSSTLLAEAEVWVEQDTVVSTTLTDENGFYALIGLLEGNYTVRATKTDHDTVSVADISVISGNITEQNFVLTPGL